MFCQRCGHQNDPNANFCIGCGIPLSASAPNRVMELVRDKLCGLFCTLFALGAAFTLIGGSGLPVFNVLLAIFFFIVLNNAKKGLADVWAMRCVSGTVYGMYVFFNVIVGIVAVCSVIIGFYPFIFKDAMPAVSQDLYTEFADLFAEANIVYTESMASVVLWIVAALGLLVAGILLVYNVFVVRNIHLFAKSVYKNLHDGQTPIVHAKLTKIWMWVAGICCCISTLSAFSVSFYAVASMGCNAAAFLIIAVLVDRYFVSNKVVEQENQNAIL